MVTTLARAAPPAEVTDLIIRPMQKSD